MNRLQASAQRHRSVALQENECYLGGLFPTRTWMLLYQRRGGSPTNLVPDPYHLIPPR